jgi:hypothetical protein
MIIVSIWSRLWLDWYCLIPLAISIVWTYYNPRAFRKPKTTKGWCSKGVFGERVWIDRKKKPIPKHHATAAIVLSVISALGLPFLVYGVYYYEFWITILGLVITINEDMKSTDDNYASWEY